MGDVHSDCRKCVAFADDLRAAVGINAFDVNSLSPSPLPGAFYLFLRERGTYAFTQLAFEKALSMRELVEATLSRLATRPKNLWLNNDDRRDLVRRVYAFYLPRPAKVAVLSNEELALLPSGTELEVIFV
jgi:hypothetical protein